MVMRSIDMRCMDMRSIDMRSIYPPRREGGGRPRRGLKTGGDFPLHFLKLIKLIIIWNPEKSVFIICFFKIIFKLFAVVSCHDILCPL